MSWLRRDSDLLQISVQEVRFTALHIKVHSLSVELVAAGQRYTTHAALPAPVDPVSHRHKCRWPEATLAIPLRAFAGTERPTVTITFWDRKKRRSTELGKVECSFPSFNNESTETLTLPVDKTPFTELNMKVDLCFEVNTSEDGRNHWFQEFFSPRAPELPYEKSRFNILQRLQAMALNEDDAYSLVSDSPRDQTSSSGTMKRSFWNQSNASIASTREPQHTFQVDVASQIEGIVFLEIVSIRNLPRFRTLTGLSFDMDPFVVVSFGKKTFRTSYRRHTTNPTFNQRILLTVGPGELNYDIVFTVWDKDKITLNDKVATASLPLPSILKNTPEYKNGLYDLESHGSEARLIAMKPVDRATKAGSVQPEMLVNVHYLPFPAIRQQLWRGVFSLYDTDDTNKLSVLAVKAMMNALGITNPEKAASELFCHSGREEELSSDELVLGLEKLLHDDFTVEDSTNTSASSASHSNAGPVINLRICPMCQKLQPGKLTPQQVLNHIGVCASREWAGSGTPLLDDRYVTGQQASRRWYTKFLSKFSYGSYYLGANSANILVQDRQTGQIDEEKMNAAIRLGIRLVYSTAPVERSKIKTLLKKYTIRQGLKYDHPSSKAYIKDFIKFHNLDMHDVLYPVDSFSNFNEFFYRQLKPGARPCEQPDDPRVAVSLADCRLTCFRTVDDATRIWIKGKTFSIKKLLGDTYPEDASRFNDGSIAVFRLAPQDYHRVHIPVDGILGEPKHIPGHYFTVNPMAIRSNLDVYGENARTVVPIDSPIFGRVIVVLVGAMMVGSIVITAKAGSQVKRTDELGYFKFGGSTCVILFEKGKLVFDSDLTINSDDAIETLVKVGMSIGHTPDIAQYSRKYDTRRLAINRARTTIVGGGSYLPFSLD
ncbi:Phosphatidylserine decarboxylase proenzyme 2 [Wickerhamiella sorbophila]|uniref:Phosphatidylserine decarboxylase proenzyme 2 n=1 Tax=Wickerhamiella sorbophila TaxID=45607 RepID=A0A2T0FLE1_9ASCO|nr:Phosphatidylserine decarboxylase proenzyme 2 [Wickerhamiella sorbophila]PRT55813.1 Phosphatidylserine decarboxylase proenzyme 2 [Wickerhamiella sorbophila]